VRKGAHVSEYGVLGALAERALAAAPVPSAGPVRAVRAGALVLVVAATDEGLQARRPERTGSALDVVLDLAGAALGVALARRLSRPPPRV
jgi:VanZ family protein